MTRLSITGKLHSILQEIDQTGCAELIRLTVLKKWFEQRPERMTAFALWMARLAATAGLNESGTDAVQAGLFAEARTLLGERGLPEQMAARAFRHRLNAYQNNYERQAWGSVRLIKNWNLYLIEIGLDLYLDHRALPASAYRLAAGYCQHYDPRYGSNLNGPARAKVEAILEFVQSIEQGEHISGE